MGWRWRRQELGQDQGGWDVQLWKTCNKYFGIFDFLRSFHLALAPSQGGVQGYLVCSPVLTGHCLLLATPGDGWGVERGFDAQIGFRARFDQSESSTPAQATNERPAAFLRGNLGGERGSGELRRVIWRGGPFSLFYYCGRSMVCTIV